MSRLSLALLEMQRIYSSAGDGGGGEEVNSEDHSPRNETACMSLDHRCGASMRLKELQEHQDRICIRKPHRPEHIIVELPPNQNNL